MKRLIVAVVAMTSLSGCAGLAFMNKGIIGSPAELYSDTMANELVTENALSNKMGEGCATSILGIVTTGDASVSSAAAKAGITRVAAVDNKFNNILGLFAKYCIVVVGE